MEGKTFPVIIQTILEMFMPFPVIMFMGKRYSKNNSRSKGIIAPKRATAQ